MGGTSSTQQKLDNDLMDKTIEEIVPLLMPVYYTAEAVTLDELKIATDCWQSIIRDEAHGFHHVKTLAEDAEFPETSTKFFFACFFSRLFDIHPLAKDLFKDTKTQGKFLIKMVSLSLSEHANPIKFEKTLVKLAEIHNDKGVKAIEYGMVGEALFWALRECVGLKDYSVNVHIAWVKIFSRLLKTMVPVALTHELQDGTAQEKRLFGHTIKLSATEEMIMKNLEDRETSMSSVSIDSRSSISYNM